MVTGGTPAGPDHRGDARQESESDVDRRILQAVRSLDYGSVEVIVHDSRIVQIERREKVRFDRAASPPAVGGRHDPPGNARE